MRKDYRMVEYPEQRPHPPVDFALRRFKGMTKRRGTISDQIFFLGRHILLLVGRFAHASTPEQIVELRKQNEVEKVCRLTVFITSGEK